MKIELSSLLDLEKFQKENLRITGLTIGAFDTFHKGHVEIIKNMTTRHKSSSILILKTKESITDSLDYTNYFKSIGIKKIYIVEMKTSDYQISGDAFIKIIKVSFPNLKFLFVGKDWCFGKNKEGDIHNFSKYNIQVSIHPFILENNKKISSSSIIKNLYSENNFNIALNCLAFNLFSKGIVLRGQKIGKEIGFPTANLKINSNYFVPIKGIYFTKLVIGDSEKIYSAITNVGFSPTINKSTELKHESHIINFNSNIYNKNVKCYYMKRVSKERNHNSKNELISFIKEIKNEAISFFRDE